MQVRNETAEAIWIVIKRVFKWISLTIATITLLFLGFLWYHDMKDAKESRERQKLEDQVLVTLGYGVGEGKVICDKGYPYFFLIENESPKVVNKVNFSVEIRRRGYSSALNRYTSLTSDKILAPGQQFGGCFRAVQDGSWDKFVTETDVEIDVKFKSVTFQ